MTTDEQHNAAIEILNKICYITVASVTPEGDPWNSPVYGVHDDALNFYWFSDKESQHSINVRNSGQAFIVVYDSTVPEGQGKGVYLQVTVSEIEDPDTVLLARRIKKKDPSLSSSDEFLGNATRRVYKATPTKAWTNDVEIQNGIFVRDVKVELSLEKLMEMLRETA